MKYKTEVNETAAAFKAEMDKAFSKELFSSQEEKLRESCLPLKQDHENIEYYVSKRELENNPKHTSFSPERKLHNYYWPNQSKLQPQLIVLEGREGIGKSTFIKHYFRYFLPYYPTFEAPDSLTKTDPKEWKRKFAFHVMLYIDLRRASDGKDMFQHIFESCREQLMARFGLDADPLSVWTEGDISSHNSYQMWNETVNNWDSQFHKDLCGEMDEGPYRAKHLREQLLMSNDQEFVINAIRYISQMTNPEGKRRFYITLVLDNADQMSEDAQLKLIRFATKELYQDIPESNPTAPVTDKRYAFWKIVVPIRPETYKRLHNDIDPFHNKTEIPLRPVDNNLLLNTRGKLLKKLVKSTERFVQELVPHQKKEALVKTMPRMKITSNECAASLLYDWFNAGISNHECSMETEEYAYKIYLDLVDGSSRRLLKLRRHLSTSRVISHSMAQANKYNWSGVNVSAFYFFEGLLCGTDGVFEHSDKENLILNAFQMGNTQDNPYSLLIGALVIWMIANHKIEFKIVAQRLQNIGFVSEDIDSCRDWLIRKQLIKPTSRTSEGDMQYHYEDRVIKAHADILSERAYIDNVAIAYFRKMHEQKSVSGNKTTELELEERITDPLDYDDFLKRIETSCVFLNKVKDAQDSISHPKTASGRHSLKEGAFKDLFDSLKLPDLHRMMCASYRVRGLSLLRSDQSTLKKYLKTNGNFDAAYQLLKEIPFSQFDPHSDFLTTNTQQPVLD